MSLWRESVWFDVDVNVWIFACEYCSVWNWNFECLREIPNFECVWLTLSVLSLSQINVKNVEKMLEKNVEKTLKLRQKNVKWKFIGSKDWDQTASANHSRIFVMPNVSGHWFSCDYIEKLSIQRKFNDFVEVQCMKYQFRDRNLGFGQCASSGNEMNGQKETKNQVKRRKISKRSKRSEWNKRIEWSKCIKRKNKEKKSRNIFQKPFLSKHFVHNSHNFCIQISITFVTHISWRKLSIYLSQSHNDTCACCLANHQIGTKHTMEMCYEKR